MTPGSVEPPPNEQGPTLLVVTRDAEFRQRIAAMARRVHVRVLAIRPDDAPDAEMRRFDLGMIDERVAGDHAALDELIATLRAWGGAPVAIIVAVRNPAIALKNGLLKRCDDIAALDSMADLMRSLLCGQRLVEERRGRQTSEATPGVSFQTLIESGPFATYANAIDPSETVIYASPQTEDLLQTSRERFYDADFDWRKQLHPDDYERISRESALADAGLTRTMHDYRYRLPDGNYRWVRSVAQLAQNARGTEFWIGNLFDIDDAHQEREAAERHATEIEFLHRLRRIIAQEEDLRTAFEQSIALLAETLDLPMVRVYSLEDDQPVMVAGAGDARDEDLHPDHRQLIDRVLRSGETAFAGPQTEGGVSLLAPGTPLRQLTAEAAAPLRDRGRVIGVLTLGGRRAQPIQPGDIALAESVGEYLSMAAVRARLQQDARQQGLLYQTVVERVSDVIFQLTPNLSIAYVNPAWSARLGYPPDRQIGMSLLDVIHPADRDRIAAELKELASADGGMIATETQVLAHDGQVIWMELRALTDPAGGGLGDITGMLFDISARRRSDAELRESHERFRRLAFQDPLTGLPNRLVFADRLQHALAVAERRRAGVAVLFIDLDGFKPVNDLYGHAAGDRVLTTVGERLRERMRGGDTIARFGGDEFAVILEDLDDPSQAMAIATELIDAMQAPIHLGVEQIEVGISIGITYLTGRKLTAEEAVAEADKALYEAKSGGRSRYALFERPDLAEGGERHRSDLRRGIRSDELTMLYYPIVALASGEVAAIEMRLRWDHPVYGRLTPGHFLRRADASGLFDELGQAVLSLLGRDVGGWFAAGLRVPQLRMTVSGRQALDARIDLLLGMAREAFGLPGSTFGFEMTDGSSSAEREAIEQLVLRLRELGATVGYDNYGAGSVTLSGLARIRPEFVNINVDALDEMDDRDLAVSMLRATLRQTDELGWTLIAKEVHTSSALALVEESGIIYAQGDVLYPARTADGMGTLLRGDATFA